MTDEASGMTDGEHQEGRTGSIGKDGRGGGNDRRDGENDRRGASGRTERGHQE